MARRSVSAALVLLCASVLVLAGCSTTAGYGKRAARSARDFQEELQVMPGQIDAVMNDLNTLTAGTTTNRADVFKQYSKDLEKLEDHAKSVAHARDEAVKNSQKYFREWLQSSRSYKDPAKRDAALRALDAGQSQTNQALAYLNQGADDFRSLTDQLNEIKSTLARDMSPANVQKVGSNLGPVLDKADDVKQYIARLDEQIDAALAAR